MRRKISSEINDDKEILENPRKPDNRAYKNFKFWPSQKLQEVINHPYNQGSDGHDYQPYIEEIKDAYWKRLSEEDFEDEINQRYLKQANPKGENMSARSFDIKKTRKFGNVKIKNTPDEIVVTLHQTDIAVYNKNNGSIKISSGGWRTPTTKMAINNALSQLEEIIGVEFPRISQVKGQWFLGEMPFKDGMTYAKRNKFGKRMNPMRKVTLEYSVGKFEDFSPEQQEKIIDNYRDINVDYDWWDFVYEDMISCLEILGFYKVDINFSGFSSQGDGASFTGYFTIGTKSELNKRLKKLSSEAPDVAKEAKSLGFADMKFDEEEMDYGKAEVYRTESRYVHENTITSDNEDLKEFARSFSQYIYRQLKEAYYHLTSDEAVRETLEANEYEFDERTLKID